MGVTIHFEGNLKSPESIDSVIALAKSFAEENNFKYSLFQEQNKLLERVKDEQNWDYQGRARGILLNLHINCDPLNLEFDENFFLQEYCKTQFAGTKIHILIIDLLHLVEPFFDNLRVNDEGEYWTTGDVKVLEENLETIMTFD